MPDFPRRHLAQLHEFGARLLDSRKPKSDLEPLARELLAGFADICMRTGLDGLAAELEPALDDSGPLVERLRAVDLDGGGPRNARPGQLADSVVAALGLTLVDEPDRTITLDDGVRAEVARALASEIDGPLTLPHLRDAIIAKGRELCEEHYHPAFDKLVAHLDERGMKLLKQPKVPVDALHAVQRVLAEARDAVIGRAVSAAIDKAKHVIERADAEAGGRIDRPVTHKLTPRDVAILRACDARVPKQPAAVVACVLDGISELAHIAWRAPEQQAKPYAVSQKFAVGDLIDHPKFGRGSVVTVLAQRIEVEFADGKHTLVHAK
jgi:hypothetical protein